jgi:hypothetical protein
MNYAVEMGSGAMIYITRLHKDWFRHSKFDLWGIHGNTESVVIS